MIRINVWPQHGTPGFGGNVGHGSLSTGSTYMSWWPESGSAGPGDALGALFASERSVVGSSTTVRGANETFRVDVLSESNRQPLMYDIPNLFDESAIERAWSAWRSVGTYNLAERSCCTCVVSLLEAGGLARIYPSYRSILGSSFSGRRMVTPAALAELGRALRTDIRPERFPTMSRVRY